MGGDCSVFSGPLKRKAADTYNRIAINWFLSKEQSGRKWAEWKRRTTLVG